MNDPTEQEIEQKVERFVEWVRSLDYFGADEAIRILRSEICMYCGGESGCHCWNDE